jgi:hypothetical protein
MNISEASKYYELGVLKGFDAIRDPMTTGNWLLVIESTNGKSWTLETALKKPKSFSSLDTAAGEIEKITGRVSSCSFSL